MVNDVAIKAVNGKGVSTETENKLPVPVQIEKLTHFKTSVNQVYFEFIYLVFILAAACTLLLLLYNDSPWFSWADNTVWFYSIIGAFLGGWVYDAKWFYLCTSLGKNNEFIAFKWDPNKFYWRILIPFISAVLGFTFYIIVRAGIIPFMTLGGSNIEAFGFSFIFGYFSEVTVSKIASWVKKPEEPTGSTIDGGGNPPPPPPPPPQGPGGEGESGKPPVRETETADTSVAKVGEPVGEGESGKPPV